MSSESENEPLQLAEVRRFDFLYEAQQAELRRICSIATTLLGADRASVTMVDSDHLKGLEIKGLDVGDSSLTNAPTKGEALTVTASFGVAKLEQSDIVALEAAELLLHRPDVALFSSKEAGSNQVMTAA